MVRHGSYIWWQPAAHYRESTTRPGLGIRVPLQIIIEPWWGPACSSPILIGRILYRIVSFYFIPSKVNEHFQLHFLLISILSSLENGSTISIFHSEFSIWAPKVSWDASMISEIGSVIYKHCSYTIFILSNHQWQVVNFNNKSNRINFTALGETPRLILSASESSFPNCYSCSAVKIRPNPSYQPRLDTDFHKVL